MQIKILKNRSDIGAGTRGSDMGIDAMEIAAILQNNHYFNDYDFQDIDTHNETIYNKDKNSFAKRIGHVKDQCQRVADAVSDALNQHFFPIVISGDHSSALGTISGIIMAKPDINLGVIWIDAHADIHTPYTSPTGNIHGMPLAAALNFDNKHLQINELIPETLKHWENLKSIGHKSAKIQAQNLVYFGVRDTEEAEDIIIKEHSIKNYKVDETRHRGLPICLAEAIKSLDHCEHLYISFDVDSLDKDLVSNGTGTPVSKGFDIAEVEAILQAVVATNKVICLEIVEINPLLDTQGNKMAEVAFAILDKITKQIKKTFKKLEA